MWSTVIIIISKLTAAIKNRIYACLFQH